MSSFPTVSVVIPTLGRTDVLFNTLKQVKSLTYKDKEIIVVDQNEREIADKISNFCEKEGILHIHLTVKSTTRAKNEGISVSRGRVVVFFDDDIEIHTFDFIETFLKDLEDQSIGVVTARVLQKDNLPLAEIKEVGVFDPLSGYMVSNWNFDKKVFVSNIAGGACAVRKEDLVKVGKFNVLFGYNFFFEETELALRLQRLGYKILFDPDAEVLHLQADGGARVKSEFSHMVGYCYNYALLLICNYSFYYFMRFLLREDVKRIFSYVLKGFNPYKFKMLMSAMKGTCLALVSSMRNVRYIYERRSISN